FDPERLRRFEVEGQFDPGSLLDWQIGWFLAFENTPSIDACLAHYIAEAAAIAHQATDQGVLAVWEDRGHRMAGRQRRELFHAPVVEGSAGDQDRTHALSRKSSERRFEIAIGSGIQSNELQAQRVCRRLQVSDDKLGSRIGRVHENAEQGSIGYQLAE